MNPERTRVVLATLAEEMAVREALELETILRERRMGVGPMIVNQRVPSRFGPEEIEALGAITDPGPALLAAIEAAGAESALAASQDASLAPLADGARTLWQLPRIIDHEPAALLTGLVAHLSEQAANG